MGPPLSLIHQCARTSCCFHSIRPSVFVRWSWHQSREQRRSQELAMDGPAVGKHRQLRPSIVAWRVDIASSSQQAFRIFCICTTTLYTVEPDLPETHGLLLLLRCV